MRYLAIAVLILGLAGCPKDRPVKPVKPVTVDVQELLRQYNELSTENKKLLQADAERRTRQQVLQGTVKRWLYVASVVLALMAFFGTLARIVKNVPSWWGVALAKIGGLMHWREIVVAAILAPGCFLLSWYLVPIWWYAWATLRVLCVLGLMFASWQICHRVHTGVWDFVRTKRRRG